MSGEAQKSTASAYAQAEERARQAVGGAASGPFAARAGVNGDVLSAAAGSGLIWTEGTGMVRAGALVDATAGVELAVGAVLTEGHRYLAGSDVELMVISASAQWMGEGAWSAVSGEAVPPFTDVPWGQWYYGNVAYVYQNKLFGGVGSGRFDPLGKMQRCMVAKVLYRMAGEPPAGYAPLFKDVPDGQWYTDCAIWAGQTKVMGGKGEGRFDLFSNVTRQEIAVTLYRYAERLGCDMGEGADLSGFSDGDAVASWGRQAVSWAVDAKILKGSGGALRPTGDATRAEVAAMFQRFDEWVKPRL